MQTDSDLGPGVLIYSHDEAGNITHAISKGTTLPTTASKFAVGCILIDGTTGKEYYNSGTVAAPVWKNASQGVFAVRTTGVTAVNVFGAVNGFAGTLRSFKTISGDATAANIKLYVGYPTATRVLVGTIAKGTSIGGIVGCAIMATTFTAPGTLQAVSDAAGGDAVVEATFSF